MSEADNRTPEEEAGHDETDEGQSSSGKINDPLARSSTNPPRRPGGRAQAGPTGNGHEPGAAGGAGGARVPPRSPFTAALTRWHSRTRASTARSPVSA